LETLLLKLLVESTLMVVVPLLRIVVHAADIDDNVKGFEDGEIAGTDYLRFVVLWETTEEVDT
jgi:hypothetical protein